MNKNFIVGFSFGVVIGIGGTLLFDYISNKLAEKKYRTEEEIFEESEVNPPRDELAKENEKSPVVALFPDNKPELEELVDYSRYSQKVSKYNPDIAVDTDRINKKLASRGEEPEPWMLEDIEEPKTEEEEIEEREEPLNIFDEVEVSTESFTKEDAIPPAFRDKKITGPHDIQEISETQYRNEALDYRKVSCTYFLGDHVLVDSDTLEILDISTTVGKNIIDSFETEDAMILYSSNLTTEVDYEIVADLGTYVESVHTLTEDAGDEECQEETS